MNKKASCIIIGEDGFTVACADLLLKHDYQILCLISNQAEVIAWACQNNLPCFETIKSLQNSATFSALQFDYLFSASNSYYIPKILLNKTKKLAVNYHSSLLPKYAGINSTSWAIYYNEKKHGITWHLLNEKFDDGCIVKQVETPISSTETALSLNYHCYKVGIKAFEDMLISFQYNSYTLTPQNSANRSYFGKSELIPNNGLIDWTFATAEKIERSIRSLTLGIYPNDVGKLKIKYDSKDYYIVNSCLVTSKKSTESSGTIVHTQRKGITVATQTQDIQMELLDLYGKKIPELFSKIKTGKKLSAPDAPKTTHYLAKQAESNHLRLLINTESHSCFPNDLQQAATTTSPEISIYSCSSKRHEIEKLMFSLAFYLWLFNNKKPFTIFVSNASKHEEIDPLLTPYIPFQVCFKKTSMKKNYSIFKDALQKNSKPSAMYKDLIARARDCNHNQSPTVIFTTEAALHENQLSPYTFVFSKSEVKLHMREGSNIHNSALNITKNSNTHMHNMLSNFCAKIEMDWKKLLSQEECVSLLEIGKGKKRNITFLDIFNNEFNYIQWFSDFYSEQNIFCSFPERQTFQEVTRKIKTVKRVIFSKFNKKNSKIAVFSDRSLNYVITILSILELGYTFIPIESTTPAERIKLILSISNADGLLTSGAPYIESIHFNLPALTFNDLFSINHSNIYIPESHQATPDGTAYIIFTSGTTGKPKGVQITHNNIKNYCLWFASTFDFYSKSSFDFSSSIAFDLSIPSIFLPLLAGGTVCVCPNEIKLSPQKYLEYLNQNNITHVELTPGFFNQLVSYLPQDSHLPLNKLKWVMLGAESLIKTDILQWNNLYPKHKIVNEYGPTETTVAVTACILDIDVLRSSLSIPIGKPALNTQLAVVDCDNHLVPHGAAGELCVSGKQVSLGYINTDSESASFLIMDIPYFHEEKFYKTGDLVRWNNSNELVFIGRIDSQIKIHGYRIDPIEVESNILAIHGIRNTKILIEKNNPSLVAYIVLHSQHTGLNEKKIKKILSEKLPRYMLPDVIHFVSYIPLKANEKIDTIKLKHMLRATEHSFFDETMSVYSKVSNIWSKILLINENFPSDADFFSLGGSSISALRITSKINQIFGTKLYVDILLKYRTVNSLAKYIIERNTEHLSCIQNINNTYPGLPNLILIHPVGGSIICYRHLAAALEKKINVFGIFDPHAQDASVSVPSLRSMIDQYSNSIIELNKTQLKSSGKLMLGGASFGANIALDVAAKLQNMSISVAEVILLDGWANYPTTISIDKILFDLCLKPQGNEYQKEIIIEKINARRRLLEQHTTTIPSTNITLLKASRLWNEFRQINNSSNHWGKLVKNLEVITVFGDHVSIMSQANANMLSQMILKIAFNKKVLEIYPM